MSLFQMEVLETGHAMMSAYEVLRVVKKRQKGARKYMDGRDKQYLGEHERVQRARDNLIPSLLAHAPEGTEEDGNDKIAEAIPRFCRDVQKLCPTITLFQLRNVLAVRPRNPSELACLFPTDDEWGEIAEVADDIVECVRQCFPLDAL